MKVPDDVIGARVSDGSNEIQAVSGGIAALGPGEISQENNRGVIRSQGHTF